MHSVFTQPVITYAVSRSFVPVPGNLLSANKNFITPTLQALSLY